MLIKYKHTLWYLHFSEFSTIFIGPICPLWPRPEIPIQIPHRKGHLYRRRQRRWPPGSSPWLPTAPRPQGIRPGAPLVQWNWSASRARAWELVLWVSALYTVKVVFSVGASFLSFDSKISTFIFQDYFLQFLNDDNKNKMNK